VTPRRASERGGEEEPSPPPPKVELPLALSKLPPGRHRLPREFILANQRTRLLTAALGVFGERGFAKASVTSLIKEAGTSRTTFYTFFPDKEACFLATYELALEWLEASARTGIAEADTWPLQVRAATEQVLGLLAGDPRLARLCAVEVLLAGPLVHQRHDESVELAAGALRLGRAERPEAEKLAEFFERALVDGAGGLVANAVIAGQASSLSDLAPDLTELLLTIYIGPEEARRVARAGA
jgi:AcrR family transcriptional regulator